MRKITLGRTCAEVSAISLGTWSFGGANTSGKQAVGWAGQSDNDSKAVLIKCWENGINHWDTADVYGNGRSEQVIGSMWETVPRSDIFLATKVGWDRGKYDYWYHPDHMRHNIERSLNLLQTDCVDLLYLHHCNFGKNGEYFDDAIEVIRRFQEEGKTRFIGLSDWDLFKILRFIERANPDVVQPYRNVWDDTYESSALKKYIEKNNLGVCFFSPLMHGFLTGKYSSPTTFEPGDFRENIDAFKDQAIIDKVKQNAVLLKERFAAHPNPVMYGVINTLISDSNNSCVLLGQRNVQQVSTAISLGDLLPKEDVDWVKQLYRGLCKT
ncbi:MAG: aldo/keto reductase [Candidatus Marinimicrobia bacterium]|nr:aldo/keto reductase [Candidatus Neomarinimicrobiota bacterium]